MSGSDSNKEKAKGKAADDAPENPENAAEQPEQREGEDTSGNADVAEQRQVNEPPNGPGTMTGPGTGTPAAPESTYRPPATLVNDDGSPLDAPADTHTQPQPEQGYNESSSDHVYAAAGGRTIAGEDFKRVVGPDKKAVRASSLFEDNDGKTFVIAKDRVYEEFYYPGTTEVAHRLLFAKGARVPRARAEQIKAAIGNAPKAKADSKAGLHGASHGAAYTPSGAPEGDGAPSA